MDFGVLVGKHIEKINPFLNILFLHFNGNIFDKLFHCVQVTNKRREILLESLLITFSQNLYDAFQ